MAGSDKWSRAFWFDLGERVGATFLGALLGAITLVNATPVDWGDPAALWAVLGVPTAVALIKGLLANLAHPESGASLIDPPPGPRLDERGEISRTLAVVVLLLGLLVILLLFFGAPWRPG